MGRESKGHGDEEEGAAERFADLVGDARPIRQGPERIAPIVGRAKRPPMKPSKGVSEGAHVEAGGGATGPPSSRFRWPDPDEPGRAASAGVNDAQLAALDRGEPEPGERVDLHGLRRDAAHRVLVGRIESARVRGLRSLLVIHGRGKRSPTGDAVLRDAIPGWLSRGPCARHVLAFTPAPDRLGGKGATLVLLRRPTR